MPDTIRTLAIETASEACSVALFDGEHLLARDHRELGRGHAEQLVPMIGALPDKGKAARILVSLGPGSFTGLRIGIATARALGVAWKADVLGYPTLALIAAQAFAQDAQPVTVCINGGHGEWFIGDFEPGSQPGEVRSLTPEAALDRGAHKVIAGNRASDFAEILGGERSVHALLPKASEVLRLDPKLLTTNLAPIYGRAPDATPQNRGAA